MNILSIETSCDETAVSVLRCNGEVKNPAFEILGNALYSQVKEHAEFGGVYPNVAKREHARNLVPLLEKALGDADIGVDGIAETDEHMLQEVLKREGDLNDQLHTFLSQNPAPDIDAIAVTVGPGLEPALWVGINFAKALALTWNAPLVPVNHLEAHMVTPLIDRTSLPFPLLSLIISGGHTQLIYGRTFFDYEIIGETQDDAVGEAFDKVARMLELPYPGGPEISALAEKVRNTNIGIRNRIELPRPMIHSDDYNFSFSGLKTAVLYTVRELEQEGGINNEQKRAIAKEFEDAVTDVLLSKTRKAIDEYTPHGLVLGGGVIANSHIRGQFENMLSDHADIELLLPPAELATDNSVMIGIAGYLRFQNGDIIENGRDIKNVSADGRLRL